MTEPTHSEEPAEGAEQPEATTQGRTPHPDEPAEGGDETGAEAG